MSLLFYDDLLYNAAVVLLSCIPQLYCCTAVVYLSYTAQVLAPRCCTVVMLSCIVGLLRCLHPDAVVVLSWAVVLLIELYLDLFYTSSCHHLIILLQDRILIT